MIRFTALFFIVISFLFANPNKNISEQLHIKALKLDDNSTTTVASGGVVAYSPSYYITSQKMIYDKNSSILHLFGNVNLIKNCQIQTVSDEATIYLSSDDMDITPFFMIVQENQMWINSQNATLKDDIYYFDDSVMSSCKSDNPEWWFKFSSAKYDTKAKWIDTYNARIFVQNIPVLYLPYFGFPTNKDRKSGLLVPTIGYSKYEGLEYSQPIYYAPTDNYDFEFVPQTRTKRGDGLYTYYRWADSIDSILYIKTGYFKDTNSFKNRYDMKSNQHYGTTIEYNRNNLLSKSSDSGATDGLYLNLEYLNDVDYKNLEHHVNLNFSDWIKDEMDNENDEIDDLSKYYDPTQDYGKKIESVFNYHYTTNSDYLGLYARYYIDTSKDDNNETMQLLPELQYHRFSESFIFDNLYYSGDINYKNHYRIDGLNVDEMQIMVPVGLSYSFLDNYLFLDLKEKLTAIGYKYSNETNTNFKDAYYLQDIKNITLSSELLKPYESQIHTIGMKASLNIPTKINQSGDIYKVSNDSQELKDFGITKNTKNLTLSLNQYLYDSKTIRNEFSHSIKQPYIYNKETDSWVKSELENDLTFNLIFDNDIKVKLTNRTLYNHIDKKIVTSSSTADIKSDYHYAKLTHYLSRKTPHSTYSDNDTRSLELGTKFQRYYTLSAKMNYDFSNKIVSKSYIKLNMSKSCWKYSWKLENNLISAPTTNHKAQRQHTIYFTIELKSVGAFEYKYITKKAEEGN